MVHNASVPAPDHHHHKGYHLDTLPIRMMIMIIRMTIMMMMMVPPVHEDHSEVLPVLDASQVKGGDPLPILV